MIHRITIISVRKSPQANINQKLQWFGDSLGLFSLRDRDKSLFRVFIELLKAAKTQIPISSDELAMKLNLTRGTVIHHINKLMENGIVVQDMRKYVLVDSRLENLVDVIRDEFNRTCDDIKLVARDIDRILEI